MRFLGIVALTVAVIFAAAFGTYWFLGGGPDPDARVADAVAPGITDTAPKSTPAQTTQAQTTQAQTTQAQTAPGNAGSGDTSGSEEASSAKSGAGRSNASATAVGRITGESLPGSSTSGAADSPANGAATAGNGPSIDSGSQNAALPADTSSTTEKTATQPKKAPASPQVVARTDGKTKLEEQRPAADGSVPTFDVVRVEKTGEAILAGRAPAGSEVTVYDGDTPLGIVSADSRGQWVLVLQVPLLPGSHSFGITARHPDSDSSVESDNIVIVAVPEPQAPQREQARLEAGSPSRVPTGDPNAVQQIDTADSGAGSPDVKSTQGVGVASSRGAASTELAEQEADGAGESAGVGAQAGEDAMESPLAPTQVAVAPVGITEPIAVVVPRHGAGPTRILQQPKADREGIGSGSLFLDSVDYDDEGRAVIGGRADPGANLIVYLDNLPVGEALSDGDGRWAMTPESLVPVGLHQLRVDQIETGGRVLERVETPFSRADTIASHPDEAFVTVQPGNSLWRIARANYGQGTLYTVIYETNKEQIREPDLIYPGQIFRLPSDG